MSRLSRRVLVEFLAYTGRSICHTRRFVFPPVRRNENAGMVRRERGGNAAIGPGLYICERTSSKCRRVIRLLGTRSDFSIHKCGKLPMLDLSGVLRALVLPLHRVLSVYTSGVSCPVSRVTANIRPGN